MLKARKYSSVFVKALYSLRLMDREKSLYFYVTFWAMLFCGGMEDSCQRELSASLRNCGSPWVASETLLLENPVGLASARPVTSALVCTSVNLLEVPFHLWRDFGTKSVVQRGFALGFLCPPLLSVPPPVEQTQWVFFISA